MKIQVNFSNKSGKARNITVRVFIKDDDNESLITCLPNIYGKSSGLQWINSTTTQITWHNKVIEIPELITKLSLGTTIL